MTPIPHCGIVVYWVFLLGVIRSEPEQMYIFCISCNHLFTDYSIVDFSPILLCFQRVQTHPHQEFDLLVSSEIWQWRWVNKLEFPPDEDSNPISICDKGSCHPDCCTKATSYCVSDVLSVLKHCLDGTANIAGCWSVDDSRTPVHWKSNKVPLKLILCSISQQAAKWAVVFLQKTRTDKLNTTERKLHFALTLVTVKLQ